MESFIITLNDNVNQNQVTELKNQIINNGGKITHHYDTLPMFTCMIDQSHYTTLSTHPQVESIEKDSTMKTM
jgi:Peptidase inhibitor I9